MIQKILLNKISDILKAPVTDKEKIDGLLELDARMYTVLGKSSTFEDKAETRRKSVIIYKEISKLDNKDGDLLLKHLDK